MSQQPSPFPQFPPQQQPPPPSATLAGGYPLQQHQQPQQHPNPNHPSAYFSAPANGSHNNTPGGIDVNGSPSYLQAPGHQQHHHQQQQQQQIHHPQQAFAHGPGAVPLHGGAATTTTATAATMMGGAMQQPNATSFPPDFQPYPYSAAPATAGQVSMPPSAIPHTMPPTATATPPNQQQFSTPPRPSQPAQAQMQPQGQMQPPPQNVANHATPQNPPSPQRAAREKARVSVLLEINSALLQEVVNLQSAGKAGVTSNQPTSQQASPTQETSAGSPGTGATENNSAESSTKSTGKPSAEYVDCMRRLQANLAYLATVADRGKKTGGAAPPAPAIMTPPPSLPSVNELYDKLKELFPGAPRPGVPLTPQQVQQAQQLQQQRQQRVAQGQPHPQQQLQQQQVGDGTGPMPNEAAG